MQKIELKCECLYASCGNTMPNTYSLSFYNGAIQLWISNKQKVSSIQNTSHDKSGLCGEAEEKLVYHTLQQHKHSDKCTCKVNLQQLKKLEMESHTHAIQPETSDFQKYNDVWCNPLKHTGHAGKFSRQKQNAFGWISKNAKNLSYFSPIQNQASYRFRPLINVDLNK